MHGCAGGRSDVALGEQEWRCWALRLGKGGGEEWAQESGYNRQRQTLEKEF